MPLDKELAFRFMQLNYQYGLLDEVGSIVGEALETVMREKGMDTEDLLGILDGASEQSVERANSLVSRRANLFLKLAVNGPMTRLQARLLGWAPARRAAVKAMTRVLGRSINPVPSPCLREGAPR